MCVAKNFEIFGVGEQKVGGNKKNAWGWDGDPE